jgi:hypothetical protein
MVGGNPEIAKITQRARREPEKSFEREDREELEAILVKLLPQPSYPDPMHLCD